MSAPVKPVADAPPPLPPAGAGGGALPAPAPPPLPVALAPAHVHVAPAPAPRAFLRNVPAAAAANLPMCRAAVAGATRGVAPPSVQHAVMVCARDSQGEAGPVRWGRHFGPNCVALAGFDPADGDKHCAISHSTIAHVTDRAPGGTLLWHGHSSERFRMVRGVKTYVRTELVAIEYGPTRGYDRRIAGVPAHLQYLVEPEQSFTFVSPASFCAMVNASGATTVVLASCSSATWVEEQSAELARCLDRSTYFYAPRSDALGASMIGPVDAFFELGRDPFEAVTLFVQAPAPVAHAGAAAAAAAL